MWKTMIDILIECSEQVQRASPNRNFVFVNAVYRWDIGKCEGHVSHKLYLHLNKYIN
jgi:hypothetical protein